MPALCIVVPCFNEEARLRRDDLVAFLAAEPRATLCLVDDGSTDGTRAALEGVRAARPAQVIVRALERNQGKAEAVRQGVLHAEATGQFALLGYWDADLSTPFDEVGPLLRALTEDPGCHLVMGSRVKRLGARIDRRVARHVMGRVFATFASGILGLPVYDSQCGAKLFRRELVDALFREPFLTRWLFDLEMLVRLRNALGQTGLRAVTEVPLGRWADVRGSKLKLRDLIRVPVELVRIRTHYGSPDPPSSRHPG